MVGLRAGHGGPLGGQPLPYLDDSAGVERESLDALVDQPLGGVGAVGGSLPADADMLARARHASIAIDSIGSTVGSRVKAARDERGITVEHEGELGEVVRPDGDGVCGG